MIRPSRVSSVRKPVVVLIASLAGVACSGSSSPSAQSTTTSVSTATTTNASVSGSADAVESQFVSVVDKVRPSIVLISTTSGLGSGVIYDTKGDIVTNAHVVGDAHQFTVGFVDGKTMKASLVGTYPPNDLAEPANAAGLSIARDRQRS